MLLHRAVASCCYVVLLRCAVASCCCVVLLHHDVASCCCIMLLHCAVALCCCVVLLHHDVASCCCIMMLHRAVASCCCVMLLRCPIGSALGCFCITSPAPGAVGWEQFGQRKSSPMLTQWGDGTVTSLVASLLPRRRECVPSPRRGVRHTRGSII